MAEAEYNIIGTVISSFYIVFFADFLKDLKNSPKHYTHLPIKVLFLYGVSYKGVYFSSSNIAL